MNDLWTRLQTLATSEESLGFLRAGVLLLLGALLARLAGRTVSRLLRSRTSAQGHLLARRAAGYGVFILFAISALNEAGFNLNVLLGAAGLLTVALGFASQTSVSNLISGLFLLGEGSFEVGDVIKVEETTGVVESVDWLSVKLRTFDNLFIRLPNETLLKSRITNYTRYPIRRLDVEIGLSYRCDLDRVRKLLLEIADRNPLCMDEPKPMFWMLGFGDSSINVRFSVWHARENLLEVRTGLYRDIHRLFGQEGIEIPFPQRTLTFGDGARAITLRFVEQDGDGAGREPRPT